MALSDNIKRLRTDRGWTQEQLADMVGVSRATVTQWETGWSQPRMGAAQKLAGVFGVQVSEIVDSVKTTYACVKMGDETIELTADERELVETYRRLDYTSRVAVRQLADTLSPETGSDTEEGVA